MVGARRGDRAAGRRRLDAGARDRRPGRRRRAVSDLDRATASRAVDPRRHARATCSPSRSSSATRCGARSPPASAPRDQPGGLVVCGMGGSAIGGDLARRRSGDRATRPITVVRGLRARVLDRRPRRSCCARATRATPRRRSPASRPPARPARERVVLTTGGKLAELAREEGVPVIGVPAGHAAARGRDLHDDRRRSSARRCAAPRRRCTRRSTPPRRCSSGSSRSGARTRRTTRSPRRSRGSSTARSR